jgi:hypothetical protein
VLVSVYLMVFRRMLFSLPLQLSVYSSGVLAKATRKVPTFIK